MENSGEYDVAVLAFAFAHLLGVCSCSPKQQDGTRNAENEPAVAEDVVVVAKKKPLKTGDTVRVGHAFGDDMKPFLATFLIEWEGVAYVRSNSDGQVRSLYPQDLERLDGWGEGESVGKVGGWDTEERYKHYDKVYLCLEVTDGGAMLTRWCDACNEFHRRTVVGTPESNGYEQI